MKNFFSKQVYMSLYALTLCTLFSLLSFGQDSAASTSSTTHTVSSSTAPSIPAWAWVIGGIVLIIIIVALASRNKGGDRTDKVTYTKTTSSE